MQTEQIGYETEHKKVSSKLVCIQQMALLNQSLNGFLAGIKPQLVGHQIEALMMLFVPQLPGTYGKLDAKSFTKELLQTLSKHLKELITFGRKTLKSERPNQF